MHGKRQNFEPNIIGFCCNWCSYAAADLAGTTRMHYPPNIKIIRVPCTGKIDVLHLLKAFEKGADGVFVAGCLEGQCHYLTGNLRAKKRIQHIKKLLSDIGIGGDRVEFYNLSASMGGRFVEIANEMTERIKSLGPNPLKSKVIK